VKSASQLTFICTIHPVGVTVQVLATVPAVQDVKSFTMYVLFDPAIVKLASPCTQSEPSPQNLEVIPGTVKERFSTVQSFFPTYKSSLDVSSPNCPGRRSPVVNAPALSSSATFCAL